MINVERATFVPIANGGELQADMKIGRQSVNTSWPLGEGDTALRSLLDRLTVKVQQISFASTPAGGEIQAEMTIGGRSVVSRWPVDSVDAELKSSLDQLMNEIVQGFVGNVESALHQQPGLERAVDQQQDQGYARPETMRALPESTGVMAQGLVGSGSAAENQTW